MKKYALILVAVVLVMSASAFVVANQSNSQPPATYWFLMDASGTQVTTTQSADVDLDCSNKDIEPDCAPPVPGKSNRDYWRSASC